MRDMVAVVEVLRSETRPTMEELQAEQAAAETCIAADRFGLVESLSTLASDIQDAEERLGPWQRPTDDAELVIAVRGTDQASQSQGGTVGAAGRGGYVLPPPGLPAPQQAQNNSACSAVVEMDVDATASPPTETGRDPAQLPAEEEARALERLERLRQSLLEVEQSVDEMQRLHHDDQLRVDTARDDLAELEARLDELRCVGLDSIETTALESGSTARQLLQQLTEDAEALHDRLHQLSATVREELIERPSSKQLLDGLTKVCRAIAAEEVERPTAEVATKFHGKSLPSIPIEAYLARLYQYFECSDTCLVMTLVYIERISRQRENFTVSRWNLHRVLATSLVVAAKFYDDVYFSNKFFAQVCGVSVKELNRLEAKFLDLIEWRLQVTPKQYNAIVKRLAELD